MKSTLLFAVFLSVLAVILPFAGAFETPELIARDTPFWPEYNVPPFSEVGNPNDSGVIRVLNADFDPLKALPELPESLQVRNADTARYQLVQFRGPIMETQKSLLRAAGLEPVEYAAHFTFICRLTQPDAVTAARALPDVRWIGPFEPAYRIDPLIGQTPVTDRHRIMDDKLILIVTLFDGEDLESLQQAVAAMGAEVLDVVSTPDRKSLHIRVYPDVIPDLARIESVFRIEEKGEFFLLNDETKYVIQSGSTAGGTPVWDHGVTGTGQIIGIMDSGVDPDHCFFYDSVQGNPTSTVNHNQRKIVAYREYGGEAWDGCDMGHGTHVAGTALGYPDDGSSNLNYRGMAPGAKLTVGDIGQDDWLSCFFGAVSPPSSLTQTFTDTMADGGFIHTNSWGSTSNSYETYCTDVDNFMWNNKNFLVLFAAGNSGPNASTVGYPGTAKNLVCVGGSDNLPNIQNMYTSSSRGPVATSNRMAPTLTAPATDTSENPQGIHSADNTTDASGRTCGIVYSNFQGTSMACPAAAGAAALVRQYFIDGYYPGGTPSSNDTLTPTAALMKAMLINSTQNMTGTTSRPSNDQGWGRILLDDALYFAGDEKRLSVYDETTGVATGETDTYDITISSTSLPVKITLVWTDRSGNNLVNDLDLVLTGGTDTYYGNNFASGWSSTVTTRDRTNPAECIYLNAGTLPTGTYTVHVEGYNVPNGEAGGRQPYALVISGGIGPLMTPTPTPTSTQTPSPTPTTECVHHGDVNFDSSLTAGDAQLAFNIALGTYIPSFVEECAADCTGDGSVTAGDAQAIFFAVLGTGTCVDPI
ncbi:S8 family serine peptidase [bacterium]|nr:S8 family serine peptidase [candidate division CSSED10-310 bacterium]